MADHLQVVCTHCMNVWETTEKPDVAALSGALCATCPRCGSTGFITGEVLPEGTLATAAQRRLQQFGEKATIPRDCPWIDPPEWWNKGLKAWGELLTEQWEKSEKQQPRLRELKIQEAFERVIQQAERDKNDMVIDLLLSNKQP